MNKTETGSLRLSVSPNLYENISLIFYSWFCFHRKLNALTGNLSKADSVFLEEQLCGVTVTVDMSKNGVFNFRGTACCELVSWYFKPSQPPRIPSGLKANFSLSSSYSAHKSSKHIVSKIYKISPDTNLYKNNRYRGALWWQNVTLFHEAEKGMVAI